MQPWKRSMFVVECAFFRTENEYSMQLSSCLHPATTRLQVSRSKQEERVPNRRVAEVGEVLFAPSLPFTYTSTTLVSVWQTAVPTSKVPPPLLHRVHRRATTPRLLPMLLELRIHRAKVHQERVPPSMVARMHRLNHLRVSLPLLLPLLLHR